MNAVALAHDPPELRSLQSLTGQVIERIDDVAHRPKHQLIKLLLDSLGF